MNEFQFANLNLTSILDQYTLQGGNKKTDKNQKIIDEDEKEEDEEIQIDFNLDGDDENGPKSTGVESEESEEEKSEEHISEEENDDESDKQSTVKNETESNVSEKEETYHNEEYEDEQNQYEEVGVEDNQEEDDILGKTNISQKNGNPANYDPFDLDDVEKTSLNITKTKIDIYAQLKNAYKKSYADKSQKKIIINSEKQDDGIMPEELSQDMINKILGVFTVLVNSFTKSRGKAINFRLYDDDKKNTEILQLIENTSAQYKVFNLAFVCLYLRKMPFDISNLIYINNNYEYYERTPLYQKRILRSFKELNINPLIIVFLTKNQ